MDTWLHPTLHKLQLAQLLHVPTVCRSGFNSDTKCLSVSLSCLYGLLYVIWGLVDGRSPGFRIVLCCFTHFPGVAMFVMAFLCFGVCLFTAIPDRVDTMLSPLRSLLDVAALANQSHSLLVLLVFCFGVFVAFFVCCLFVVALLCIGPCQFNF